MNLTELQREAYSCAVEKGWHESDELVCTSAWWHRLLRAFGVRQTYGGPTARQKLAWLALVTDELDEAFRESEDYYEERDGKPCGVVSEYADALIRVADAMAALGFELSRFFVSAKIPVARTELVSAIRNGEDTAALWNNLYHSIAVHSPSRIGFEQLYMVIEKKMAYNRTRTRRHGGKLA